MVDHTPDMQHPLHDSGERMIPASNGEISFVFARHEFTYRHAARYATGKRVLDVGCGTGYGSAILAAEASAVLGIDQSADAIAYCTGHYSAPVLTFRQADAMTLSLDAQFDLIVAFQIIEHLDNPDAFLGTVRAHLTPGGVLLLTTPNAATQHGSANPFHVNEMGLQEFSKLLQRYFSPVVVQGIAHSTAGTFRQVLRRLPFYRFGGRLRRTSKLKKVANAVLDLTTSRIIDTRIAEEAIDLFAICTNPVERE